MPAPYSIIQNDVIQLTLWYTLDNQQLLNTFHYQYRGATPIADGPAALQELMTLFSAGVDQYVQNAIPYQSDNLMLVKATAQLIYPGRWRAEVKTLGIPGEVDHTEDGALPANVALSISRYTREAYRGASGRIQVPGLTGTQVVGSLIAPGAITNWGTAAETLRNTITDSLGNVWTPVLFRSKATPPAANAVTSVEVQGTSRVMHRRTVRVGI